MSLLLLLLACWPGALPDCPDCAGNDDLDGDGFTPNQGDCLDTDPDVNPDATEVCNGLDDDCDPTTSCALTGELSLREADVRVASAERGAHLGEHLHVIDGAAWVSAPDLGTLLVGAVYLFEGPLESGEAATLADFSAQGDKAADGLGSGLGVTDDRLVARESSLWNDAKRGVVALLPRDVSGDTTDVLAAASAVLEGADQEKLGATLAASGDDLLLSSDQGGAWWVPDVSELEGTQTVSVALADFLAYDDPSALALGDLDGDGAPDAVLADATATVEGRSKAGLVQVFVGPDAAARSLQGPDSSDKAGLALAVLPDLDGDGLGELFVGGAERSWLVSGAQAGDLSQVAFLASASPHTAAAVADLDGDGVPDLALGEPTDAGRVEVFYGPVQALDAPDLVLLGEGAGHGAGSALAVGDLDGDGLEDLLIGAPGESSLSEDGGAVYLLLGRAL